MNDQVDQPTPREDLRAIITKLCQDAATTGINHPAFPVHREHLIDSFFATWFVEKPTEIGKERAAQAEWQKEAKSLFSAIVVALKRVGGGTGVSIGEIVMAATETILHERGVEDPDELMERMLS
ncbi:hypothetical protein AU099_gp93 [Gordonia phage GTE8]|uniref:Uncharacterized protein n=1 Tax=Gordonia phage GTE8 TaxID=1647475 RepID=A0A0K0N713_9CAUD|nr:hypothetical protein AU099_gp93 [Gordonia phage GTE8]AKJ72436.1 hypothetical protein GTE8_93 [Gordonia phage GTE8]